MGRSRICRPSTAGRNVAKQASREKRFAERLARGAEAGAAVADRAAVLAERLWMELIAPAMLGSTSADGVLTNGERTAMRKFMHQAVLEDVSLDHITEEAARGFVLDKWMARCDKQCCSLLSLQDSGRWPLADQDCDTLRVASVGGGPGNDAFGAFLFAALARRWQRVDVSVFDFSPVWRPFCEAISGPKLLADAARLLVEGQDVEALRFSLAFQEADLRAPTSAAVNETLLNVVADVDVFLFSHVVRESQACCFELLPTVFRRSRPGAVFLFLDMHPGDVLQVQELVERLEREDAETATADSSACRFEVVRVGCSAQYAFFGLAFLKRS